MLRERVRRRALDGDQLAVVDAHLADRVHAEADVEPAHGAERRTHIAEGLHRVPDRAEQHAAGAHRGHAEGGVEIRAAAATCLAGGFDEFDLDAPGRKRN